MQLDFLSKINSCQGGTQPNLLTKITRWAILFSPPPFSSCPIQPCTGMRAIGRLSGGEEPSRDAGPPPPRPPPSTVSSPCRVAVLVHRRHCVLSIAWPILVASLMIYHMGCVPLLTLHPVLQYSAFMSYSFVYWLVLYYL